MCKYNFWPGSVEGLNEELNIYADNFEEAKMAVFKHISRQEPVRELKSMKDMVVWLREGEFSIAQVSDITGLTITEVCEVLYEQNNIDKSATNQYDGVF